MLDLEKISKTFNAGTINEKRALNGLELHLQAGDFVTVIGGNGAGKSTMLNAIAGTWFVDQGRILIDGVDVTRLSEHKRARYLGRVFQDPMTGTAASMQIEENLALASRRGKPRTLRPGITSKERESYKEQLEILEHQREYLLDRVHAEERRISCLDYLIYQIQGKPARKRKNE